MIKLIPIMTLDKSISTIIAYTITLRIALFLMDYKTPLFSDVLVAIIPYLRFKLKNNLPYCPNIRVELEFLMANGYNKEEAKKREVNNDEESRPYWNRGAGFE